MTKKIVEIVNLRSNYAQWLFSQPGPPPGWDPYAKPEKKKPDLKVVKKPAHDSE